MFIEALKCAFQVLVCKMHSVLKFRCDTVCSSLLHPCTFQELTLTFGNVSLFTAMYGGNFLPSAMMHNIIVHCYFLLPPLLPITFFLLVILKVISKYVEFYLSYRFRNDCTNVAAADWCHTFESTILPVHMHLQAAGYIWTVTFTCLFSELLYYFKIFYFLGIRSLPTTTVLWHQLFVLSSVS